MEFISESGKRILAVTAEQMKEIDRIAIEETGPNLFQMMENAGRNLAELTMKALSKNSKQEILVLAGKGGNGGGGICAARHLANHGYSVKVCISEPAKLSEITKYQLQILKSTNAQIISLEELQNENPDLIIDAITGYNLIGKPKGKELELIKWVNDQLSIKIALDVPSGVNATTGEKYENYVKPDLILTLALPKTGLLQEITGELYLGDIGIPASVIQKVVPEFKENVFKDKYIVRIKQS